MSTRSTTLQSSSTKGGFWQALVATRAGWGPAVARIGLAAMMWPHGAQKLLGWFGGYGYEGTMGAMTQSGLPAPVALLVILGACVVPTAAAQGGPPPPQPLGPPPVPPANPVTPAKTLLGQVLFFDEQLSRTGTVACGTCHRAGDGGSDPRSASTTQPSALVTCAATDTANTAQYRAVLRGRPVTVIVTGARAEIVDDATCARTALDLTTR